MRYSEIDLQCEDIMWFGIDVNGHVLAFTSGGCGCVPEFVCKSKEETSLLEKFFLKKLALSSGSHLEIPNDSTPLIDDAQLLSQKGLFVYDVSFEDGHTEEYSIISSPTLPITIVDLPEEIIKILQDHVIGEVYAGAKYIQVEHAY